MKKLFLFTVLLIPVFIMTSCVNYQNFQNVGLEYEAFYNIELQNVEIYKNRKKKYGESKIIKIEDDKIKYIYEDSIIKILWIPLHKKFEFILVNNTNHSLKIIWDEAVYVNQNNFSGRIIHTNTKYIDKNNHQLPTILVKNTIINDVIIPSNNIDYKDGEWIIKPIFPYKAYTEKKLNDIAQQYIGKKLIILLPIKIKETINEYIFTFKVEDFIYKLK